jgi:hypothetical protein
MRLTLSDALALSSQKVKGNKRKEASALKAEIEALKAKQAGD